MTESKNEAYAPQSEPGFPQRRQKAVHPLSFTDEAEVELWEDADRDNLQVVTVSLQATATM